DGVPFLMVKRNPLFDPMSYVVDTMGMQTLWLSSVDFLALQENYDLDISGFNGGYAFLPCAGVFDDYVDKWYERKERSEGMRKVSAKLMLNSLVG
ncbi:DNA polymerase, partial [Escherichia coli]|uniref:DNA polymerase n=1 Tax=Escherichia coli TaxID=562 RepID=UPI001CC0D0A8